MDPIYYLPTHSVEPEDLVGVHMQRSLGMVLGLVGILKAGAAYVPIDPSFPQGTYVVVAQSLLACMLSLLLDKDCDNSCGIGVDLQLYLFLTYPQ